MTDEQIRQWATEIWGSQLWTELQIQRLKRFATMATKTEREACAKIVDENANACSGIIEDVLRSNATAIRARSQP